MPTQPPATERTTVDTDGCPLDVLLCNEGFRRRLRAVRSLAPTEAAAHVEGIVERAVSLLRKEPREAAELARLAVAAARRGGVVAARIMPLRLLAKAQMLAGRYPEALRALDRALAALELGEEEDVSARMQVDGMRVEALAHLECYADARETGARVLAWAAAQDDNQTIVRVRMTLADLEFRVDQPREALQHYSEVEKILPGVPSPGLRAAIAANRANALEACNRFRAAMRQFKIALEVFTELGCEHTVAQVEYNIAYAEVLRGRHADALRRFARAEEVFERLGDERHLAHVDLDRTEIHLQLNLPDDAWNSGSRAAERFARLGLGKEAATASYLMGRAAELQGLFDEAERCYLHAEEQFEEMELAERAFRCLVQRACLAERRGQNQLGAELVRTARTRAVDGMNALSAAPLDLAESRLELASGSPADALDIALRVSQNCRRIHAPWVQIEANRVIGRAFTEMGKMGAAIEAYRAAIEELENYRGGVPPDEFMAAFLAGQSELYAALVDLLVRSDEPEEALRYVERAKSRALADRLSASRATHAEDEDTPATRLLHYLKERLNATYKRLFGDGSGADPFEDAGIQAARKEAAELEQRIAKLSRDVQLQEPGAGIFDAEFLPDLDGIREQLEPDLLLIEYFVADASLFVFVVSRDEVRYERVDVDRRTIEGLMDKFQRHIAKQARAQLASSELVQRATRANLAKLTEYLLEPIRSLLESGKRLAIVPHGCLHQLPFHALPWGDEWLVDHFEVVYAPSAAVYALCENGPERANGAPAVFGLADEYAPRIADEAVHVAKLLGTSRVHLGEEVDLTHLADAVKDASVVHVATHGMFRPDAPMLSAIRLHGGWCNLYDLRRLDIRGRLFVLATCESGVARVTDGDEILGVSHAILCAGAPLVMTSQWRVDDAVTAQYMESFYGHLRLDGDPVAAQRAAMFEIRAQQPHPYHWAPFFLTGRPAVSVLPSSGERRRKTRKRERKRVPRLTAQRTK